jgi:hypothetical protein
MGSDWSSNFTSDLDQNHQKTYLSLGKSAKSMTNVETMDEGKEEEENEFPAPKSWMIRPCPHFPMYFTSFEFPFPVWADRVDGWIIF